MPITFSYKKQKLPDGTEIFRPTIPVELSYEGKSMIFVALVDSGSDVSYLPQWAASALGIEIKGKEKTAHTVSGKMNVIENFVHVTLRQKAKVERFLLPVDIPKDKEHIDEIILGRKGFFDRFDITFRENSKRIALAKSRRG